MAVVPILRLAVKPDGQVIPARHRAAEVVCRDMQWHDCQVIGFHRLAEPRRQNPHRYVQWLIRLRLDDGSEGWYELAEGFVRPVLGRLAGAGLVGRLVGRMAVCVEPCLDCGDAVGAQDAARPGRLLAALRAQTRPIRHGANVSSSSLRSTCRLSSVSVLASAM